MEYKEKYQRIVERLIHKSFPKLRRKKIGVFESLFGFYAFTFGNNVIINKRCRHLSHDVLTGILAHELNHVIQFYEAGSLRWLLLFFRYFISRKFKMKIEVEADKMAIKKGYAQQLKKSTEEIMTKLKEDEIYYGLSPKQIESYAKRIKKW